MESCPFLPISFKSTATPKALIEMGNKKPVIVIANSSSSLAHTNMKVFLLTSKIIRCSPKQKVDPNGLVLFGDDDLNRREGKKKIKKNMDVWGSGTSLGRI